MVSLWINHIPEMIPNFHASIASYQSSATSSALAVFENKLVLSIHDTAQNSVSVAHGRRAVTVISVSYNSSAIAFENDVTKAFVA